MGDFELHGGGDDPGTVSEVVDTTMNMTPSIIESEGGDEGCEDPETLHQKFAHGCASRTIEKFQEAEGNPSQNFNLCRNEHEGYLTCGAEQSDSTVCKIGTSSCSFSLKSMRNEDLYLYINALVSNLSQLYHGKIVELDMTGLEDLELLHQKVALYENWVKDISEQNGILICMAKDTDQKIETLQRKNRKSARQIESQMLMITEYQKQVQELLIQRLKDDRNAEELTKQISKLGIHHRKLEQKLEVAESEVENLVALLTRVRELGVWDINGLHLEPGTYFRLFKLYPNLIIGSEGQSPSVVSNNKVKKPKEAPKTHQKTLAVEKVNHRRKPMEDLVEAAVQASKKVMEKSIEGHNMQIRVTATYLQEGQKVEMRSCNRGSEKYYCDSSNRC